METVQNNLFEVSNSALIPLNRCILVFAFFGPSLDDSIAPPAKTSKKHEEDTPASHREASNDDAERSKLAASYEPFSQCTNLSFAKLCRNHSLNPNLNPRKIAIAVPATTATEKTTDNQDTVATMTKMAAIIVETRLPLTAMTDIATFLTQTPVIRLDLAQIVAAMNISRSITSVVTQAPRIALVVILSNLLIRPNSSTDPRHRPLINTRSQLCTTLRRRPSSSSLSSTENLLIAMSGGAWITRIWILFLLSICLPKMRR
jgi:hypothetical protein